jgi:hypothetical protein
MRASTINLCAEVSSEGGVLGFLTFSLLAGENVGRRFFDSCFSSYSYAIMQMGS